MFLPCPRCHCFPLAVLRFLRLLDTIRYRQIVNVTRVFVCFRTMEGHVCDRRDDDAHYAISCIVVGRRELRSSLSAFYFRDSKSIRLPFRHQQKYRFSEDADSALRSYYSTEWSKLASFNRRWIYFVYFDCIHKMLAVIGLGWDVASAHLMKRLSSSLWKGYCVVLGWGFSNAIPGEKIAKNGRVDALRTA